MKSTVISGLLFFLTLVIAQAQENKVCILDSRDSSAVAGVHILDLKEDVNRVSNEDGFFERPTTKGNWKVSHIGFQTEFIQEWGHVDSLFLKPRVHVLDSVALYGFDLVQYLNEQSVKASREKGRKSVSAPMLFRKRASTNGEITQLFQIQIRKTARDKLLLCGVDYAAEFTLNSPLQAGGYIESEYLLSQLKVGYPIKYLLKYLKYPDITEVRVDPEVVTVYFSGTLSDGMKTSMVLKAGILVFRKSSRQLLHIEWVSQPDLHFRKKYSKRYKKFYSMAIEKSFQSWDFAQNSQGYQEIREFNTSVFLFVRANKKMDKVELKNQIISGLQYSNTPRCKKLMRGKALIDQLEAVSPVQSRFLLSNAEKNFLKINGRND